MTANIRIVFRFVILVLLQVLVLNNIGFGGFLNPYLYVLFILSLPFQMKGWLLLILSFFTGYAIDVFSNTAGIHAAASVLMGFARPGLIRMYFPKEDFGPDRFPGIYTMGFKYFFGYAFLLVLIHHFALFYLEVFRFTEFGLTLLRAILSAVFTMIIILIAQFLFFTNK